MTPPLKFGPKARKKNLGGFLSKKALYGLKKNFAGSRRPEFFFSGGFSVKKALYGQKKFQPANAGEIFFWRVLSLRSRGGCRPPSPPKFFYDPPPTFFFMTPPQHFGPRPPMKLTMLYKKSRTTSKSSIFHYIKLPKNEGIADNCNESIPLKITSAGLSTCLV